MKRKRIFNKRTGLSGYRYRFTNPVKRKPTEVTFYASEPAIADDLFHKHMNDLLVEAKTGVCITEGLDLSYDKLVDAFLSQETFSTPKRKKDLSDLLKRNILGIETVRDMTRPKLTRKAKEICARGECSPDFMRDRVKRALTQMLKWAVNEGEIIALNPLADWQLKLQCQRKGRPRGYSADEARDILIAADDIDVAYGRRFPQELVLRTAVTAGNRPGAIFNAKINDLLDDRIRLPEGNGKKLNGACTLPPAMIQELRLYSRCRSQDDPLLLSAEGVGLDVRNFSKRDFNLAATLAFVKRLWPNDDQATQQVTPLQVATVIARKKPVKFDGVPPIDPAKLQRRVERRGAIEALVQRLTPLVQAKMSGRSFYHFVRHSHISLAAGAGVSRDNRDAQVGHKEGIEGKHYLDEGELHPEHSSQAVFDLVNWRQTSEKKVIRLPLAAGAETDVHEVQTEEIQESTQNFNGGVRKASAQVLKPTALKDGGRYWNRTSDPLRVRDTKEKRQDTPHQDISILERDTTGNLKDDTTRQIITDLRSDSVSNSPDLAELAALWPSLPDAVKAGMLATAKAITGAPKP